MTIWSSSSRVCESCWFKP